MSEQEYRAYNSSGTRTKYNLTKSPSPKFKNIFLKYYKAQNLFENEEEWDLFLTFLKYDLPTSFRINPLTQYAHILLKVLEMFCEDQDLSVLQIDGEAFNVGPPEVIPWFEPCGFGWQYLVSRKGLRVTDSTKHFKKFLANETEIGNIARQEIVSMIPVIFLDCQPGLNILDMCASPGSKSGQILEKVLAQDPNPEGIVIANDIDMPRCHTMTHRIISICCESLMITNYDAAYFPVIKYLDDNNEETSLTFDRILCDVPCSSDGTIRKSPGVFKKWRPTASRAIHPVQLAIAKRAVELLSVGGLMVYSTCSFNPLENEAVVAELLRYYDGALELVDVSDMHPDLKRSPGINTWTFMDGKGKFRNDWSERGDLTEAIESMFPPTEEEIEKFHLERCLRFFPHQGNTGGFFLGLLRKVRQTPDDLKERVKPIEDDQPEKPRKKFNTLREFREKNVEAIDEDTYKYLEEELSRFGMTREDLGYLATKSRISGSFYRVSKLIDQILRYNNNDDSLRVTYAGYKVLKNDGAQGESGRMRFTYDAVINFNSSITQRKLFITKKSDFVMLLESSEPTFTDKFSEHLVEQLNQLDIGYLVIVVRLDQSELYSEFDHVRYEKDLIFGGWKGTVTFRAFINKAKLRSIRNIFLTENYNYIEQHKEEKTDTETD